MRSGLHPLCVVVLFRELPGVEQQAPVYFDENLARDGSQQLHCLLEMGFLVLASCGAAVCAVAKVLKMADRSEEHTSELQSHLNLVCRLLLEKKNKRLFNNHT